MALVLNGSDQCAYDDLVGALGGSGSAQSLYFWVKPDSLSALGFPVTLCADGSLSYFGGRAQFNSGADLLAEMKTNISLKTGVAAATDAEWVPVVITHNGTDTLTAYVGSTTGDSSSASYSSASWRYVVIGARFSAAGSPEWFFKGKLAYVRAWDRLLTAGEVSDLIGATSQADVNSASSTDLLYSRDLISSAGASTLVGSPTFDADSPFAATGPSINAADRINSEGETVTFTLANNAAAPTSATLNGTDVGTLTDQGSGVYSYTSPLIADDDTADLVVSVDGTTASTTIAYANSYDRDQLTHPADEAEYSENSLSYPNAYATTQPYEWKVIADASASVVTIDWDLLEADDGLFKDVSSYATPVANGSTTVTLGVFVPETGDSWQFDRTITVSDGSVEVGGSRIGFKRPVKRSIRASIRESIRS